MEQTQTVNIEGNKELLVRWEASRRVLLPHYDPAAPASVGRAAAGGDVQAAGAARDAHEARRRRARGAQGRQEPQSRRSWRRTSASIAATSRASSSRRRRPRAGLITMEDLDRWQVHVEDPAVTNYKGVDVYKLNHWVQGPVMLQTLNLLENVDLKSMGYNSARYIHTLYQAMNLAFADRDFYYGDPYVPPVEPIKGLLSKEYARERFARDQLAAQRRRSCSPGDPYPFQGADESLPRAARPLAAARSRSAAAPLERRGAQPLTHDEAFLAGTTSIQAADADGWVVSITPSGGWVPAFIAGNTGFGLSQRMQSFVLDPVASIRYNVLAPGKRPRATLSPSMALQRRQAVPVVRGAGRRRAGSEPAAVLLEHGRVQDERAASRRSRERQQLPDARIVRRPHVGARAARRAQRHAVVGAVRSSSAWAISIEGWEKTSGPINAIFIDRAARLAVGRLERLRRGLRHRLVDDDYAVSPRVTRIRPRRDVLSVQSPRLAPVALGESRWAFLEWLQKHLDRRARGRVPLGLPDVRDDPHDRHGAADRLARA